MIFRNAYIATNLVILLLSLLRQVQLVQRMLTPAVKCEPVWLRLRLRLRPHLHAEHLLLMELLSKALYVL